MSFETTPIEHSPEKVNQRNERQGRGVMIAARILSALMDPESAKGFYAAVAKSDESIAQ